MKRAILLLLSLIMLILPGCWDRIEIESRAFVLGIAIDKYPPIPQGSEESESEGTPSKEREKLEYMELHTGKPIYAMTVQVPILKRASSISSAIGTGGGDGGESSTWEITQVGNSFVSMNREILSRINMIPYYEHLQVIIISEEVAKDGLENVMDFFIRDPEMRRRVRVFISAGEAKSILSVKPKIEDFLSIYLSELPTNSIKTSRMVYKIDLGETVNYIHQGYDFVLPRVEATKDEIKASGAAVFKKDKMVGWLSELELEAMKFITNRYLGGVIETKSIEGENGFSTLEITKSKCKITSVIEGERPRFKIDITVDGNYAEDVNTHTHGKINNEYLEKMEKEFAKEIERICKETIKKVQQEYNADIFQFNNILKTKEPAYWKQIKENWDSIFPNVEVEVNVKVNIILIGLAK